MRKVKLNNLILISGSGRNSGKTTLACHFIRQLSSNYKVIGLKIAPHFHSDTDNQAPIITGNNFRIFEEVSFSTNKDSSKMLNAGATKVYFVETIDNSLSNIENWLKSITVQYDLVVCESGSFAMQYKPGYHILIENNKTDVSKTSYNTNKKLADIVIKKSYFTIHNSGFDIDYKDDSWEIKKLHHLGVTEL